MPGPGCFACGPIDEAARVSAIDALIGRSCGDLSEVDEASAGITIRVVEPAAKD